jgi:hypothetical protein
MEKRYIEKDEFLLQNDRVYEDVQLPNGQWVCVQSLNAAEKDQYEASMWEMRQHKGKMVTRANFENMRARLFVMCVVHPETHQRLYSEADIPLLGKKNVAVLDVVIEAAKRLSAWDDEELEKLLGQLKNDQPVASLSG